MPQASRSGQLIFWHELQTHEPGLRRVLLSAPGAGGPPSTSSLDLPQSLALQASRVGKLMLPHSTQTQEPSLISAAALFAIGEKLPLGGGLTTVPTAPLIFWMPSATPGMEASPDDCSIAIACAAVAAWEACICGPIAGVGAEPAEYASGPAPGGARGMGWLHLFMLQTFRPAKFLFPHAGHVQGPGLPQVRMLQYMRPSKLWLPHLSHIQLSPTAEPLMPAPLPVGLPFCTCIIGEAAAWSRGAPQLRMLQVRRPSKL